MKKGKQIAAWIAIIALVGLYIATLVFAIVDKENATGMFMVSLVATIVVPVLLWFYIWLFGKMTGKKTIADSGWSDAKDSKDSES